MLFLLEDLLGLACEGLVTSTSVRDFVSILQDLSPEKDPDRCKVCSFEVSCPNFAAKRSVVDSNSSSSTCLAPGKLITSW